MNIRPHDGQLFPEFESGPLVDLQRREVSARVATDPQVHALERERLWKKTWLLVGHDSEIPNSGDHMTRYMGEDEVIVVRDAKGAINVMLNSCPHRGMALCRSDMGHAATLVCPYHGWTYGLDGQLRGMPVADHQMHGDVLTKAELGLKRARVGLHCGMIFATFDEAAPSMAEWLGDAAWYLNLMFGRTERGMEVLGPPQRTVFKANWKLGAEQFVGSDAYHVFALHRSAFEMGILGSVADIKPDSAPGGISTTVSFPQGHSLRCFPSDFTPMVGAERAAAMTVREKLLMLPPPGMTPDLVREMFDRFDEDQLSVLAERPPTVGGLFPNIATHMFHWLHPDGGLLGAAHGLHVWVPRGHNKTEWWTWQLVEKDAPEELKDRIAETSITVIGGTGILESDDAECWPAQQRVAEGAVAADGVTATMKYQAQVGENKPADWPSSAGGIISDGFAKDDGAWGFWRRYNDFMEGNAW